MTTWRSCSAGRLGPSPGRHRPGRRSSRRLRFARRPPRTPWPRPPCWSCPRRTPQPTSPSARCPRRTPQPTSPRCASCPRRTPRLTSHRCESCPHRTPRPTSLQCARCPRRTPRPTSLQCARCPRRTPRPMSPPYERCPRRTPRPMSPPYERCRCRWWSRPRPWIRWRTPEDVPLLWTWRRAPPGPTPLSQRRRTSPRSCRAACWAPETRTRSSSPVISWTIWS